MWVNDAVENCGKIGKREEFINRNVLGGAVGD